MDTLMGNSLDEQEPEAAKRLELQALEELARIHAALKERFDVYQQDQLAEDRDEREQDDERVRRSEA